MADKQATTEPEIDIEKDVLNAPKMEPKLDLDDDDMALIKELAAADDIGMSDDELKAAGLYDAVMQARATPEPKEPDLAADDQETEVKEEPPAEDDDAEGDEPEAATAEAGKMVPKARLDQALRKARENEQSLADALAEIRAELAAIREGKPARKPEAEAPEVDLDTQLDELANRYDEGEIGFAEYEREKRKLSQQGKAAPTPSESLALQAESQRLAEANPWFDDLSPRRQQTLTEEAMERLQEKGVDLKSELGLLTLRRTVVEVGAEWGWNGSRTQADTGQPPAAKGKQPAVTKDQTAAKLELAGRQPPDLTSTNPARSGSVLDMDDEAIARLTDDEMAALPDSVFKALQKRAGVVA